MRILSVAFACALALPVHAAEPNRPNIILMMADDLGWGDPGYNGNKIIKTPNLDAMARESLRFDRFYSGGPVCSPTRAACLTGRHPFRQAIWTANAGHIRKQELTLAEVLKTQGYSTGHFGKWHLGTLSPERSGKGAGRNPARNFSTPGMNGFDEWFSTEYAVPLWNPGSDAAANPYYHNGKIETENLEGCDSKVVMDRAIPFIKKSTAEKKPFFAVIWFHAPHEPVVAGPEFKAMYAKYSEGERNYYGAVTALDVQIGRLREQLRALGVEKETIVWFTSDNGPEGNTGDQGRTRGTAGPLKGRKRSLWEGGIRVPGLVEWPGRIKPGATSVPCGALDYFPTTIELLGLKLDPAPRPLDGISLVPLLEGKMTERPRPIPFETVGGTGTTASRGSARMALVDNRFKVLTDMDSKGETDLLFDLVADPAETNNIAAEHPEVLRSMKRDLAAFRKSCKESQIGRDYAEPFRPDADDIPPVDRPARAGKAARKKS